MTNLPTPSATQLGSIAENLVSTALMIESGGRLSPFQPIADDDGIDLLIYDKESGSALPAQVKSRTVALKKRGSQERGNTVHFEIRRATFRVERFGAAILVLTGSGGYAIDCVWVIPLQVLPSVSRKSATKYVLRVNKSTSSQDRATLYRCHTPAQLYARVLALLERNAPDN